MNCVFSIFRFQGQRRGGHSQQPLITKGDVLALDILGKPYSAHSSLQSELFQFP